MRELWSAGTEYRVVFDDLSNDTQKAFAFLHSQGYALVDTKMVWPNSFRGGFILTYSSGDASICVEYLEMEFKVERGGEELFGPGELGPFAGIMFSAENLLKCLDRIAAHVRLRLEQAAS
jgi:hypothetical protein